MALRYIVDGSNLAHDGGSTQPSFARVRAAISSLTSMHPDAEITVCMDATLYPRLTPEDQANFNAAERAREIYPAPSGTKGKGDAWMMAVARTSRATGQDTTLVTNDSLAEFQVSDPWLFEPNALLGGHHIDGLGWVWVERVPVDKRGKTRTVKSSLQLQQVEVQSEQELQSVLAVVQSDGATPNTGTNSPLTASELPRIGSVVEGLITGTQPYGAFMTAEGKFSGLIHQSSFPSGFEHAQAHEYFKRRDVVFAVVKSLAPGGKLELSFRDALTAPADEENFVPEVYGLVSDYDDDDNYIYPTGYDVESGEWKPGFEEQQSKYEAAWLSACHKWQRHLEWLDSPKAKVFETGASPETVDESSEA